MYHARPDYQRIQDPAGLIGEDEPVFLIRAKDMNAPGAVRMYAELAAASGADGAFVELCLKQAEAMVRWQMENGKKVPDGPHQYP